MTPEREKDREMQENSAEITQHNNMSPFVELGQGDMVRSSCIVMCTLKRCLISKFIYLFYLFIIIFFFFLTVLQT